MILGEYKGILTPTERAMFALAITLASIGVLLSAVVAVYRLLCLVEAP